MDSEFWLRHRSDNFMLMKKLQSPGFKLFSVVQKIRFTKYTAEFLSGLEAFIPVASKLIDSFMDSYLASRQISRPGATFMYLVDVFER